MNQKSKVFIIAELSANHNGSLDTAIETIRPGFGMHPKHLSEIIGKEFKQNVERGTPFFKRYK